MAAITFLTRLNPRVQNLALLLVSSLLLSSTCADSPMQAAGQAATQQAIFGFRDFSAESKTEAKFLTVPDPKTAGQVLKLLTAEPHLAATPEDRKNVDYIAQKFRAAGLDTEIVPYRVLLSRPKSIQVEAFDPAGHNILSGLTPEQLPGENNQPGSGSHDPRVVAAYNASSASGDVTGPVVYANYGRQEDFDRLAAAHIDLHGKILLIRYGKIFRGVKVNLAEQHGAAGVLIYSDPQDDGDAKGEVWPNGPWRPASGVQRGAVQYLFRYPGDAETPGIASTLDLPDSARVSAERDEPHIAAIPISAQDAEPILRAIKGAVVPDAWQGALPFRYHVGPGEVSVHMAVKMDYERRIIWDVIGKIKGTQYPDDWVLEGNHQDAWVYGAVDPGSGTAAMLETVRSIGELVRKGWRPKRTLVFCSWDAEEEGLIGSTEWVEDHARELKRAVAYFNVDIAVSGPNFSGSAVPSLDRFLREVTKSVPSPLGSTVYQQWKASKPPETERRGPASAQNSEDVEIDNLGSGSDYSAFIQHAGVPSTDISSEGPYGVYHSQFDNYAWFTKNADPHFVYLQQMARVLGIEALRMADADVLPLDYVTYAKQIAGYIDAARAKASDAGMASLNFLPAKEAASRLNASAENVLTQQLSATGDLPRLNAALRQTESALLTDAGLPNRPWFRHPIFAPGEVTGYTAQVLPGVNEAIDARDASLAARQLVALTQALDRAREALDSAH
jgi:N-acetylated-alpha-linked acidic dipeptidase